MRTGKIFLYIVIVIAILELALRAQEKLGPIYDLALAEVTFDVISDTLNHAHPPEHSYYFENKKFIKRWDKNGIRIDTFNPDSKKSLDTFKILFMGDSFMEGYDDEHTIPHYVRSYIKANGISDSDISFLNAGCSSYSPAIFIPQAKKLIPILKPDLVVVDIDVSDLGDDWKRYRNLIVRDKEGRIAQVRHTPIDKVFIEGLVRAREEPLYLIRCIAKIYHTKIYMPYFVRKNNAEIKDTYIFETIQKKAITKKDEDGEMLFFRNNVAELAETLIDLMNDRDRILFVYHPYLEHLKPDKDGFYWNDVVAKTVNDVAKEYYIAFYDTTEDLRKAFGTEPERYYYPRDIHFNFDGLGIYGRCIAQKLLPMVEKYKKTRLKRIS